MKTEYYLPLNLITRSMVLAACVGFTSNPPLRNRDGRHSPAYPYSPASNKALSPTTAYYQTAAQSLDEKAQILALDSFARKLLAEVTALPEANVNLLNEKFWDLL